MNMTMALFRRELRSYFAIPVAYVFIVIFLMLMGAFTFYLGGLYERGQADLRPFFQNSLSATSSREEHREVVNTGRKLLISGG